MNDSRETIYALASGAGRAGIALYRISGPKAAEILHALAGSLPDPRATRVRFLCDPDTGDMIDQAMVLWHPAPASFTGEDMAELHMHGGAAVGARLLEALAGFPACRPAQAGEFARRAFEAGKLDLAEIEGIADLVDAETEFQRRQAVRQMAGAQSRLYESWRSRLLQALAMIEAALDFPEEDDLLGNDYFPENRTLIKGLIEEISSHLDDQNKGERLRDGVQVVIAGPPNAGKSTLLNALAHRDAAIVSSIAGTTRDIIQVDLDLGGYPLTLMDTAGLGDGGDAIEREGVRRAVSAISGADIVLYLEAATMTDIRIPDDVSACPAHLVIRSKYDQLQQDEPGGVTDQAGHQTLGLSVSEGWNIDLLENWLCEMAETLCGRGESAVITQARHRAALQSARDSLSLFLTANDQIAEIAAEHLRHAVVQLGRITGRVDVEDLLDIVFSKLCIGK